MAIIEATEESKRWNLKAHRDSVSNYGGRVSWVEEDAEGKLWNYTHPELGDSADLYRSEVMACDAMHRALRDKLNDEFPVKKEVPARRHQGPSAEGYTNVL